jgi:hypothetical protein
VLGDPSGVAGGAQPEQGTCTARPVRRLLRAHERWLGNLRSRVEEACALKATS